jgi:hypothetical protein
VSLWPLKTQHRGAQKQRPGLRADLHGIEAETMPGRVIDQGQDLAGVPAGVRYGAQPGRLRPLYNPVKIFCRAAIGHRTPGG